MWCILLYYYEHWQTASLINKSNFIFDFNETRLFDFFLISGFLGYALNNTANFLALKLFWRLQNGIRWASFISHWQNIIWRSGILLQWYSGLLDSHLRVSDIHSKIKYKKQEKLKINIYLSIYGENLETPIRLVHVNSL